MIRMLYNPWVMGSTSVVQPMGHGSWERCTANGSWEYKCCTTHGSWATRVLYNPWVVGSASVVQPMGHGHFIVLHNPWVMGICHDVWPMGHGEKIAERCVLTHWPHRVQLWIPCPRSNWQQWVLLSQYLKTRSWHHSGLFLTPATHVCTNQHWYNTPKNPFSWNELPSNILLAVAYYLCDDWYTLLCLMCVCNYWHQVLIKCPLNWLKSWPSIC